MNIFLQIIFLIINIIHSFEIENEKNRLFLKAKLKRDPDPHIVNVYSELCDIIRQQDYKFLNKKDLGNYEKNFVISSFRIIEDLFLDENKDPKDLISLIINFPNLQSYIIDKKNAETLFTIIFIQFILFLEDIGDLSTYCSEVKFDFAEEGSNNEKAFYLLEKRVDTFFRFSNAFLKKGLNQFWHICEVLDHECIFSRDIEENGQSSPIFEKLINDALSELFISNNFIKLKKKTFKGKPSTGDPSDLNNSASFITISSFCVPKVFESVIPKDQTLPDEKSILYDVGNLIKRNIPSEGTISFQSRNGKFLIEFIIRLFAFLRSYSPKTIRINISNCENEIKMKFDIKRNSWDFIAESDSKKIYILCQLNKILHRRYIEYYVNSKSMENLMLIGGEIFNEANFFLDKNKDRKSLNRNSTVIKRMSGILDNMTLKRKSRNSVKDFNDLNESDCYDSNLLKVLRNFIELINPKEIYNFLYENSQSNNLDLQIEVDKNELSEYSEIITLLIEFGSSGYDFEYFNDESYRAKKDEIKQKLNEINEKFDIESIKLNFEIDIFNEEDEKKIIGELLLSLASYFDNSHSENVYECLIRLRRYIEGNIRKFDILLEFEIATIIVRSITMSRIKRVYITHLIYKMLSDMMN